MKATMTEILDYMETARKLKTGVVLLITGDRDIDNFKQISVSSGNINPVIFMENGSVVNCEKIDGEWMLIYNPHLNDHVIKSVDNVLREVNVL